MSTRTRASSYGIILLHLLLNQLYYLVALPWSLTSCRRNLNTQGAAVDPDERKHVSSLYKLNTTQLTETRQPAACPVREAGGSRSPGCATGPQASRLLVSGGGGTNAGSRAMA